ncbi:Uncharacterised protein [Bordetella pertussis]|nr:Uncharacterised protein [Bordetella pertussis]CFO76716.1 Uncharacterised protein [Bordetella pertussis]CFU83567.1 Uncharacterised protein [Bordetella pertussis]CPI28686.1 Uncharacterised protein [Bordetella pertussis]CPL47058.1 Uncharacterised protein [Bordetella pertussis]
MSLPMSVSNGVPQPHSEAQVCQYFGLPTSAFITSSWPMAYMAAWRIFLLSKGGYLKLNRYMVK